MLKVIDDGYSRLEIEEWDDSLHEDYFLKARSSLYGIHKIIRKGGGIPPPTVYTLCDHLPLKVEQSPPFVFNAATISGMKAMLRADKHFLAVFAVFAGEIVLKAPVGDVEKILERSKKEAGTRVSVYVEARKGVWVYNATIVNSRIDLTNIHFSFARLNEFFTPAKGNSVGAVWKGIGHGSYGI